MIKNFEEVTKELTEDELSIIPYLVKGFTGHDAISPIKSDEIISKMNYFLITNEFKVRMTGPRLRKCCNYIRSNSIIPLIATSEGYYVSWNKEEIEYQIKSLRQRAQSIINCADGLSVILNENNQR